MHRNQFALFSFAFFAAAIASGAQTQVSLSFSGSGIGNTSGISLAGEGSMTPYGSGNIAITGVPTASGPNISITVALNNGNDIVTAVGVGHLGTNAITGTATVIPGLGVFAGITSGTFDFTINAPFGPTAALVNFTMTGSGTLSIGPACTYTLSVGGQAFSAAGGTGNIGISAPQGCAWSASDIPSWITDVTQGSGDGTLSYFVTANSGDARSATITLGGISYFIEQSASSIPGLASAGSLGQVASEGTWDFSLIGINLGASAATARFTFADNNGNPLTLPLTFPQLPPASGPELAATLDRTLNPNAQIVMESTGPDSAATLVGSGQLLSNGNVSGFGIFSNPKVHWNAVVPLETRNASKYILAFDNTAPLTTGVAVAKSRRASEQRAGDHSGRYGNADRQSNDPVERAGAYVVHAEQPAVGISGDHRQARHHRVRYASRRPDQRAGPARQRSGSADDVAGAGRRGHQRRLHHARGV